MDLLSVRSVFALALLVTGVVACGGGGRKAPAAPRTDPLELAVVGVDARIGTAHSRGSGIVVDARRGLVVTTAHTIWGARTLKVATALGVLHGRIMARAPCEDLAVIQIAPAIPGLATLPSAPAGTPARDQLLRSVGRRATSSSTGAMATIPIRVAGPRQPSSEALLPRRRGDIPLDSPLVPEVAGGPIVDAAGRLVGMAQTGGVAVPWAEVRARLRDLEPGARSVYVGWAHEYRCVARQHAYARATYPGFNPAAARLNTEVAATRLPGTEGAGG